MKTLEITCTKRKDLGKKSTKKLRLNGNVPCVIYGGEENVHFYAHENSFRNLIYTHNVHLVKLAIDDKMHQAIIKDIQFHPVTDKLLHIDFMEVFDDKNAVVTIPIEIKGNSVGIRNGGKLRQRRRNLKVKGLASNIPDVLKIDITNLDIGNSLKVKDLNFDNLQLLDPPQVMIIGVVSSRLAAKGLVDTQEMAEAAVAEVEKAEGGEEETAESEKSSAEE